jgi:hypothetical protein
MTQRYIHDPPLISKQLIFYRFLIIIKKSRLISRLEFLEKLD